MIDAHVHLYDGDAITYQVFEHRDPVFETLVGDYSALPRTYVLDDYRRASASRTIEGIVWHEFIADDPLAEIEWAQHLADTSDLPMALVGIADFADPHVQRRLEHLDALPNVTAVRQHLAWDPAHPLRRMASRSDFLTDPAWQRGLALLTKTDLRCGLEVFSPQLPDLTRVVRDHPDLGFTIAVLGWPNGTDPATRSRWRADMNALSQCDNTVASISAIECVFGLRWESDAVTEWITTVVELFGPDRCMFGSHLPIDGLSYGFHRLYELYDRVLAGCSDSERAAAYGETARHWFRLPPAAPTRPGVSIQKPQQSSSQNTRSFASGLASCRPRIQPHEVVCIPGSPEGLG